MTEQQANEAAIMASQNGNETVVLREWNDEKGETFYWKTWSYWYSRQNDPEYVFDRLISHYRNGEIAD